MKNHLIGILSIAFLYSINSKLAASEPAPGEYYGQCYNSTCKTYADLKFVLRDHGNGKWRGAMTISLPLLGSGKADCDIISVSDGNIDRDVLRIETESFFGPKIAWFGVITPGELAGRYFITSTGEEGRFYLRLKKIYGTQQIESVQTSIKSDFAKWLENTSKSAAGSANTVAEWLKSPENQQIVVDLLRGAYDIYSKVNGHSPGPSPSNSNPVTVRPYTRQDGTPVQGHFRTQPDGSKSNNLSD